MPLTHSFVLGVVLVAKEAVETASSSGDAVRPPLVGGLVGLKSGDCTEGDGVSEAMRALFAPPLPLPFPLPLPLLLQNTVSRKNKSF
jgi:hypothetical protein